jgi:hypothetical protein
MIALVLSIFLQTALPTPFEPLTDFEKQYPRPTITAIAPVDVVRGRPPRIHIYIQHGHTQFVSSSKTEAALKSGGLAVGAKVDIREQHEYLYVRGPGRKRWVKLRLISKSQLFDL